MTRHDNNITYSNRSLECKDQSGNEVIDNILKPESDTNPQRTGQQSQVLHAKSCGRQGQQEAKCD